MSGNTGVKAKVVGGDLTKKTETIKRLQKLPLSAKIEMAFSLMEKAARQAKGPLWCCYSGGKDSTAVLSLMVQKFGPERVLACYNAGTFPLPGRVEEIQKTAERIGARFAKTQSPDILEMWQKKGFYPLFSKRSQTKLGKKYGVQCGPVQCCYQVREAPFMKAMKAAGANTSFWGIRASESSRRFFLAIDTPAIAPSQRGRVNVYPILYWTLADVMEYLALYVPWFTPRQGTFNEDCLCCATDISFFPNNLSRLYFNFPDTFAKVMRSGLGAQILKANKRDPSELEKYLKEKPLELCKINGLTKPRRKDR